MSVLAPTPSSLHRSRRDRELAALADGEVVDLLVVGGGATGTGVALDAATRGLSVALVERHDLAHGTSRWSSKLVHGGLRYLAAGKLAIAHESAVERGVLMEHTAPHLTRRLAFIAPVGAGYRRAEAALMRATFAAADLLRVAAGTSVSTLPRAGWASREQVLRSLPALRGTGVGGGAVQWEGQLTDDARLVIAIARTAAEAGARVLTRVRAEQLAGDGAVVRDELTGQQVTVHARAVVNATGVWADQLHPQVSLRPSKGAHVLLPAERLGHPRAALLVPVREERNRFVFALPQPDERFVVVGLTDDPVDGVDDEPTAGPGEVAFLLNAIGSVLPDPLTADDVVGSYAGLRPLLASASGATADLSREHRLLRHPDGFLTIVGGKLTTYRRMAQDAVDRLVADGDLVAGRSVTTRHPLVGAAPRAELDRLAVDPRDRARYGTDALRLATLVREQPELGRPLFDGSPHRLAELAWGLAHEGALDVDDLLDRRLRVGLVAAERVRALPAASEVVSHWSSPATAS